MWTVSIFNVEISEKNCILITRDLNIFPSPKFKDGMGKVYKIRSKDWALVGDLPCPIGKPFLAFNNYSIENIFIFKNDHAGQG